MTTASARRPFFIHFFRTAATPRASDRMGTSATLGKSAVISGSGVFRDANTDERARQVFFSGEIPGFQVIIPGFGIVEGPFQITALEYAGSHNGEATYEVALASAGVLTFTAL